MMGRRAKAVWILAAATVVWGTSFPLTRALAAVQQEQAPLAGTWFLAALTIAVRFGVSGLILLLISGKLLRPTRAEVVQGLGLAVFASGGLILQIDGLYHTTASVSAFLTQTYCILIPLWVAFRRRKWPPLMEWVALALVTAGVVRLSGVDWQDMRLGRGEWETLLGSVFFAGQILWLERPIFRENRTGLVSVLMFLCIAVVMLAVAGGTTRAAEDWAGALQGAPVFWLLAVLTLGCTLFTFTMMNRWQPAVTATEAGLIYCLEPVFAAVFALFLPGWLSSVLSIHSPNEVFSNALITGGLLIFAANVLMQLFPGKNTHATPLAVEGKESGEVSPP